MSVQASAPLYDQIETQSNQGKGVKSRSQDVSRDQKVEKIFQEVCKESRQPSLNKASRKKYAQSKQSSDDEILVRKLFCKTMPSLSKQKRLVNFSSEGVLTIVEQILAKNESFLCSTTLLPILEEAINSNAPDDVIIRILSDTRLAGSLQKSDNDMQKLQGILFKLQESDNARLQDILFKMLEYGVQNENTTIIQAVFHFQDGDSEARVAAIAADPERIAEARAVAIAAAREQTIASDLDTRAERIAERIAEIEATDPAAIALEIVTMEKQQARVEMVRKVNEIDDSALKKALYTNLYQHFSAKKDVGDMRFVCGMSADFLCEQLKEGVSQGNNEQIQSILDLSYCDIGLVLFKLDSAVYTDHPPSYAPSNPAQLKEIIFNIYQHGVKNANTQTTNLVLSHLHKKYLKTEKKELTPAEQLALDSAQEIVAKATKSRKTEGELHLISQTRCKAKSQGDISQFLIEILKKAEDEYKRMEQELRVIAERARALQADDSSSLLKELETAHENFLVAQQEYTVTMSWASEVTDKIDELKVAEQELQQVKDNSGLNEESAMTLLGRETEERIEATAFIVSYLSDEAMKNTSIDVISSLIELSQIPSFSTKTTVVDGERRKVENKRYSFISPFKNIVLQAIIHNQVGIVNAFFERIDGDVYFLEFTLMHAAAYGRESIVQQCVMHQNADQILDSAFITSYKQAKKGNHIGIIDLLSGKRHKLIQEVQTAEKESRKSLLRKSCSTEGKQPLEDLTNKTKQATHLSSESRTRQGQNTDFVVIEGAVIES